MVFSSILFLFTFLPITLLLYYISPKNVRNLGLLVLSLIFYGWGEPIYIFLMIFTIIFDYFMGLKIHKYKDNKNISKTILIFTIAVNILILGFFKYYGFLIENINTIFNMDINSYNLPLPIGISFYTFQILSYIIDVYLEKVDVQKNLVSFALYVTMFPQLVAGPIVRYSSIDYQLNNRVESTDLFGKGVERFIIGLGKKVLLANNIGFLWNTISQTNISQMSVLTAWIGIIAFTMQIYFDFSGYSDMAIGLGKMFGFEFDENFNYPYTSKSITEFWRRWHISLGSWFREYVYIPCGGNRCSAIKQFRNIFIVWMLTGLWHGASWNFVVWGIYYGMILFIEKVFLMKKLEKLPNYIRHIYTMIIVMVGWVFFSLENLSIAIDYLKVMFFVSGNSIIDQNSIYLLSTHFILIIILLIAATPIVNNLFNKIKNSNIFIPTLLNGLMLFLALSYLITESYNPFLYFRF